MKPARPVLISLDLVELGVDFNDLVHFFSIKELDIKIGLSVDLSP